MDDKMDITFKIEHLDDDLARVSMKKYSRWDDIAEFNMTITDLAWFLPKFDKDDGDLFTFKCDKCGEKVYAHNLITDSKCDFCPAGRYMYSPEYNTGCEIIFIDCIKPAYNADLNAGRNLRMSAEGIWKSKELLELYKVLNSKAFLCKTQDNVILNRAEKYG